MDPTPIPTWLGLFVTSTTLTFAAVHAEMDRNNGKLMAPNTIGKAAKTANKALPDR